MQVHFVHLKSHMIFMHLLVVSQIVVSEGGGQKDNRSRVLNYQEIFFRRKPNKFGIV